MSLPRVGSKLVVLCCAALLILLPEGRGQVVISASAGMVHYAEGRVLINEAPLVFDPTHFVHLKEGQRLSAERGRAELMLIPDVLLRLDSGAAVEMVAAGLTDARVRLLQGSCTVEVRHMFESGGAEVLVAGASVRFDRNGLYRLHLRRHGAPLVQAFAGRAFVTTPEFHSKLKTNRSIRWTEQAEQPRIEKLDRFEYALLDEWTRVGDTGRRVRTLGQNDQASESVLGTKLECQARSICRIPGLDCVLPPVARRTLSFNGSRLNRAQAR